MAQRGAQHLLTGGHQFSAPWAPCLKRTQRYQAGLQQQQLHVQVQQHTTAQVAAYPAFTDDNSPTGGGVAVTAAGPTELPHPQQQQQQQLLTQQQQEQQQQQRSWFSQAPWVPGQQQDWQEQRQRQVLEGVSAALQRQQEQQQQQQHEQQVQQPGGDAVVTQLQECAGLADIAALVKLQQHEHHLTLQQALAALQRLCSVTRVAALTTIQQQQLQDCCSAVADVALHELQQLGHTDLGQLLAMFQVLGYRPEGAWVRCVLQHAGTELVHYSPAELSLLLLTATQASARCGSIPGPDTPVIQLQPSRRVPQSSSFDAAAGVTTATRQEQQQQLQQQQQRRANTVLTSAWLQHFLATFQPYVACRSPHPQLSPGHMEAVITCLAALRVAPDRFWMYLFVRQMAAQLPSCSPGSVVRMLGGLATLGYRLPDHVLLQVERQIGTAAAMVQLRAEECVEVVRSVAVLRAQQSKPSEAWLQQLLAAAVRGSSHLSASAVIGLLAGTAALGLQLDPSWMDVLLLQARAALSAMTPHEHVTLIDALAQQQHQYRPGPVFMAVYLAQVAAHLPELTIGQQTALATGLATVGYKPAANWMSAFIAQLVAQPVAAADGDDLLQLLRALRRMQYVPAPNVAQQLSGLIDSIQLSVPYNLLLLLREALDELQYQRGIMAVPRRAAGALGPAAAASAGVSSEAAGSAAGQVSTGVDVVAIEGVMDAASAAAAAAQVMEAVTGVAAAAAQVQSAQPGREDNSAPAAAAQPAAVLVTTAVVAEAADAAGSIRSGEAEEAGSAAVEQEIGSTKAPGSKPANAVGVAQQSLELFA